MTQIDNLTFLDTFFFKRNMNTGVFLFLVTTYGVLYAMSEGTGPICYKCSGVSDVTDCLHIERCGLGQVCFTEKDPSDFGENSLGCRNAGVCKNVSTDTTCTACCHGDLCNRKGCGIRENPQVGPVCYQCQGKEFLEDCAQVKHCSFGERIGQKFAENVEVISGLNFLVINKIASNNTGDYRCIAKNLCGMATKYVNVEIIHTL